MFIEDYGLVMYTKVTPKVQGVQPLKRKTLTFKGYSFKELVASFVESYDSNDLVRPHLFFLNIKHNGSRDLVAWKTTINERDRTFISRRTISSPEITPILKTQLSKSYDIKMNDNGFPYIEGEY
jgi:hypothetical protein